MSWAMPYVAGFGLDVYCKHDSPKNHIQMPHNQGSDSFSGRNLSDCLRQAKKAGWKIHKDKTATCPICAKEPKP